MFQLFKNQSIDFDHYSIDCFLYGGRISLLNMRHQLWKSVHRVYYPYKIFVQINLARLTAQKMKFSIKNFFSKCDQIHKEKKILFSACEQKCAVSLANQLRAVANAFRP